VAVLCDPNAREREIDDVFFSAGLYDTTARRRSRRSIGSTMSSSSANAEIGEDRGQMLPGGADAGWEVTAETMAL
jgi:hypothetical protein